MSDVRTQVVDAKNFFDRPFLYLTQNFYIMKSALRYFSVKKGMSFTSSKLADNFPISTPVAGSCLKILNELEVVDARSDSSSPDRYMPEDIDLNRLEKIEQVLVESKEIQEFKN